MENVTIATTYPLKLVAFKKLAGEDIPLHLR
jgi:hypothetical protein